MKRTVLLGCLMLAVGVSQAGAGEVRASNKYLIELKGGVPTNLSDMVAGAGGTLLRVHPQIGKATAVAASPQFAARMAQHPAVSAVRRDLKVQMTEPLGEIVSGPRAAAELADEVDPTTASLFPCQWHLDQIDAPEAWAMGHHGSHHQKVAIIDSGADPHHIDLHGRIDEANSVSLLAAGSSECGADDETTFHDYAGHGTFMASLVTSNSINIAAVAPDTEIVAIKALNCRGQGEFSDLIAGILYAADLPDVTAISLSIGGFVPRDAPGAKDLLHATRDAVDYAVSQGKVVVTVAGNQGMDLRRKGKLVAVPTESGQAIGVYATDVRGQLASYSNWGFPSAWIGAPGGDNLPPKRELEGCSLPLDQQGRILGACSSFVCDGETNAYITGRGTSIAAPLVAGVAALVNGKYDGSLSAQRIKVLLKNRADDLGDPGTDPVYGHGRVNAARAVNH